MSEEERELLARISAVAGELDASTYTLANRRANVSAGQINRHKNQQAGINSIPARHSNHSTGSCSHPSAYRPSPVRANLPSCPTAAASRRGTYHPRPYRVGRPTATHRHRTLVLNNSGAQTPNSTVSDGGGTSSDASTTWVSRNDRHLQLINAAVYEKDTQNRTKAIEETRQQRIRDRDQREKAKLRNFVVHQARKNERPATNAAGSAGRYEIDIEGIRFAVAKNGSKLLRLPGMFKPPGEWLIYFTNMDFLDRRHQRRHRHPKVCSCRRCQVLSKQKRQPLPGGHRSGPAVCRL